MKKEAFTQGEQKTRRFIAQYLGLPLDSLKRDVELWRIVKNPHEPICLQLELEEAFNFEISDDKAQTLNTIHDYLRLVANRRRLTKE